jgi:purine-nucleoside phosphorylase
MIENLKNSVGYVSQKASLTGITPTIGIILGSGLGKLADDIDGTRIMYSDIPGFRLPTTGGHSGNLVIGRLCSRDVVTMQGRLHYYEGYSMNDIVYPVRLMRLLGIKKLIITNAAGGINPGFSPGDLMVLTDHINFSGRNPLIGKNMDELGTRFPDMSRVYSEDLIKTALSAGVETGIRLQKGVYAWMTGPSYETPAEIRLLKMLGADAVGMSTVPEAIAARHAGMDVLGISCITNMTSGAAGILDQPLSHNEVIETAKKVEMDFARLIRKIVEKL